MSFTVPNPNTRPDGAQMIPILSPQTQTEESTSFFGAVMLVDDKVKRERRFNLFIFILSYCLGLGNIWRFPRQALLFEAHASFVYLFISFSTLFGIALLFLESALGQYGIKGFMHTFDFCPFLSALPYSMVIYSVIANIFYNTLAAYSITYLVTAFYPTMPHAKCSTQSCRNSSSPEHYFFFTYLAASESSGSGTPKVYWRVMLALMAIWCLIFVTLRYQNYLQHHKVAIGLTLIIIVNLLVVVIYSSIAVGSEGLLTMFYPKIGGLIELGIWVNSIEQTIISLGIGSGPLLTFWSANKYVTWSYWDLLGINVISGVCSILSGVIIFNAAVAKAQKENTTVASFYVKNTDKYYEMIEDFHLHIMVSELCNSFKPGVSNFFLFICNVTIICSFFFTAIQYTNILVCMFQHIIGKRVRKSRIIIIVCCLSFLMGTVTTTYIGFEFVLAIDRIYLGLPLLFTIFWEMWAVAYYYGLKDFSDDVEFLLLFMPGMYYRFLWMTLPLFFGVFIVCSFIIKYNMVFNNSEIFATAMLAVTFLVPLFMYVVRRCRKWRTQNSQDRNSELLGATAAPEMPPATLKQSVIPHTPVEEKSSQFLGF